jgi:NhaP-type Na+/H+ or K+/H+ antiporter
MFGKVTEIFVGGKFARKHVPINLRQILSAESAANDGLAYPFLMLAIYLTVDRTDAQAIGHWFLVGWLCKLVMSLDVSLCSLLMSIVQRPSPPWHFHGRHSWYVNILIPHA